MKDGKQRIFFILGDQLSLEHPFVKMKLHPVNDLVLMIESLPRADWLPYHPQKLLYVFSCMRRYAHELKKSHADLPFHYVKGSQKTFAEVIGEFASTEVHVVEPSEPRTLEWMKEQLSAKIVVHSNSFFLADDSMLAAKPPYLLESFYRSMRVKYGILMDNGKPEGGQWNFDEENRLPPSAELCKNPPPDFLSEDWFDDVDLDIYRDVEAMLRAHLPNDRFGRFKRPTLPTNAASAAKYLKQFIALRLEKFGPYEDAMVAESAGVYHSGLSALMNLQIISPQAILRAITSAPKNIPISSKEGFVRQIVGWREFVRLVYLRHRPEYASTNFFAFKENLPPLYWGAPTQMNCLSTVIQQVHEHAYSHHITRLMVLGNFALLTHTEPQQINSWFWSVYLDAYEWVVTPNVLGMSQFADGGVFATKPYVSGANYIKKMSNYCKGCAYDPKKTIGEDACPFNALYWDFIDVTQRTQAHRASFARRMGMMWSVWKKKSDEEQQAIRRQAELIRTRVQKAEV